MQKIPKGKKIKDSLKKKEDLEPKDVTKCKVTKKGKKHY